MKTRLFPIATLALACLALCLAPPLAATVVTAGGGIDTYYCGNGLNAWEGTSVGTVSMIDSADIGKQWTVAGQLYRVASGGSSAIGWDCSVSGTVGTDNSLQCASITYMPCKHGEAYLQTTATLPGVSSDVHQTASLTAWYCPNPF